MKKALWFLLWGFGIVCPHVHGFDSRCHQLVVDPMWLTLNVEIAKPKGDPIGDVLYLTGFSDAAENHHRFMEKALKEKLRVISFDYPKHGKSTGWANPDHFGLDGLAKLAVQVEEQYREDEARPLILSGWSTGGLVAEHALRRGRLSRRPSAMILESPAFSPRWFVGRCGFVTQGTLANNPDPEYAAPIRPWSPFCHPLFALSMLRAAKETRNADYPVDVPTLLLLSDNKADRYVLNADNELWGKQQSARGAQIWTRRYAEAKHDLQHDAVSATDVINRTTTFARAASLGNIREIFGEPSKAE